MKSASPQTPRVGLEVHVRLATESKLFCACPNTPGDRPNTHTCPVCAGLPGAMPTLNRRAVELAMRAALVLDGAVQPSMAFDRKHYAYPDLPKGYQVTQARLPICLGGSLTIEDEGTESANRADISDLPPKLFSVTLNRIHIEEDAGRSRHDSASTHVDLSRAGAPLIEIVTEPVLTSAAQVRHFLTLLRETLRFAGISNCDMEKGDMRCDVNVSITPKETKGFARVELKNLNSIQAAGDAVESEFKRQRKQLDKFESGHGPCPHSETRGWHAEGRRSFPMRTKEHATDYRMLSEPDLPCVRISAEDIAQVQAQVPESAPSIRSRWEAELGLNPRLAAELCTSPKRAAHFEQVLGQIEAPATPSLVANWLTNHKHPNIPAHTLASLLNLLAQHKLTRTAAEQIAQHLEADPGASPQALAEQLNLLSEDNPAQLKQLASQAIEALPAAVADYNSGYPKALDALVGHMMRATKGRTDGGAARAQLLELLANDAP